jgi:class 3 adenylate cyclase
VSLVFLGTAATALWLTRTLLRPVLRLADGAEQVAAGDLTVAVPVPSNDELGHLTATFNSMVASIREKTATIEQKNRENETLLLNILPADIAERLKVGEDRIADHFADVTVLFADLVGFTMLSGRIPPAELVDLLNGLFRAYDGIAEELHIEKIKTIGDCYMAVCGLPRACPDHARRMAEMALRMLQVTREYGEARGLPLAVRIGLNSGPVVAGVIGARKFIYDLWGDTVNLASRMESQGQPGAIQVTRSVLDQLGEDYVLQARGVVEVKGKGTLETWWLRGRAAGPGSRS